MNYILVFGLLLQLLVSLWLGVMHVITKSYSWLDYVLIVQFVTSIITFIFIFKQKWRLGKYFSLITGIVFLFYIIKSGLDLFVILSLVPLLLVYMIITGICIFKFQEENASTIINKRIKKYKTKNIPNEVVQEIQDEDFE